MAKRRRQIVIVRSLTSSDLGLFAAHRSAATSKQRAININSQVADRLLSPALLKKKERIFDCSCSFLDITDKSPRVIYKSSKNWRLGGNKLEDEVFADIDCVDFALIRSVENNDGSFPISMTFIARALMPDLHAQLSSLVSGRLKHSMMSCTEDEPGFIDIAAMCPAPPSVGGDLENSEGDDEIPPMPRTDQAPRGPRTVKQKLQSPHLVEQMLKVSSDMSAPAQLQFLDTVEQLASALRELLLATGRIIKIEKDHGSLWKSVAGKKIGFVDGGMANLSMLGSSPVAVRVGGYIVTPGDRSDQRESFIPLKMLISELYASPEGSVYDGSYPDIGALRDAARISIEAAGGVKVVSDQPDVSWLFMHGSLVNPVSRYTDVMRDGKPRYRFPNFSPEATSTLLDTDEKREGRDANFISVYLRQLEILQESKTIVCGVVERESHGTTVIKELIKSLDDEEIRPFLSVPPQEWKHWFLSSVDPADEDDGQGQRITDPLLFRCVLEPSEALRPVRVDRNEERRAPEAWKSVITRYPAPMITYIQPTEWNAPVRMEMFKKDLKHFEATVSLVMHCSLLLPKYAFPVGLDIVDKFAKIPDWMSRPINTNTAVQALKKALDRGDARLFDALRRMMCGSQREWLLRPGIYK